MYSSFPSARSGGITGRAGGTLNGIKGVNGNCSSSLQNSPSVSTGNPIFGTTISILNRSSSSLAVESVFVQEPSSSEMTMVGAIIIGGSIQGGTKQDDESIISIESPNKSSLRFLGIFKSSINGIICVEQEQSSESSNALTIAGIIVGKGKQGGLRHSEISILILDSSSEPPFGIIIGGKTGVGISIVMLEASSESLSGSIIMGGLGISIIMLDSSSDSFFGKIIIGGLVGDLGSSIIMLDSSSDSFFGKIIIGGLVGGLGSSKIMLDSSSDSLSGKIIIGGLMGGFGISITMLDS